MQEPPFKGDERYATLADELHRRAETQPRHARPVIAHAANDIWTADLAEFPRWFAETGHRYALVVVDVFTRRAWALPLKGKTAAETWAAFQVALAAAGAAPKKLWTDEGSEFKAEFAAGLAARGIELYHTYGKHKAALAERFIRTLKGDLARVFTRLQTHDWVKHLPAVLAAYNGRTHSSLRMSPDAAYAASKKDAAALWAYQYGDLATAPLAKPRFAVGDTVRVVRTKDAFERGHDYNWSHATYKIAAVLPTTPLTYKLVNFFGHEVKGSYYESDLQRTALSDLFIIDEEAPGSTTVDGQRGVLETWRGYKTGPGPDDWKASSAGPLWFRVNHIGYDRKDVFWVRADGQPTDVDYAEAAAPKEPKASKAPRPSSGKEVSRRVALRELVKEHGLKVPDKTVANMEAALRKAGVALPHS